MRVTRDIDGETVYDNGDPDRPEYDAYAAKLAELRTKGWGSLNNSEKGDLVRLFFEST